MPARKGLLAPQNTFLDTIATRFDGTHSNFVLGNAKIVKVYPIVYCSDGFCELTGYSRAQIMQKSCACNFLYGQKTDVQNKQAISRALESKQELKLEVILYKSSGTPFWCLLDIVPIQDEKHEVVLFLCSHKDITKQKWHEQQQHQLAQLHAQKQQLQLAAAAAAAANADHNKQHRESDHSSGNRASGAGLPDGFPHQCRSGEQLVAAATQLMGVGADQQQEDQLKQQQQQQQLVQFTGPHTDSSSLQQQQQQTDCEIGQADEAQLTAIANQNALISMDEFGLEDSMGDNEFDEGVEMEDQDKHTVDQYSRRRSRAVLYQLSGHYGYRRNEMKSKLKLNNRMSIPEYKTTTIEKQRFILSHYGVGKSCWDWLILIVTFYVAIIVPYNAVFKDKRQEVNDCQINYLDMMVEVVFIIDLILNFRTTFVNRKGEVVTRPRIISMHYLKGWFVVDLCAALPIDLLCGLNLYQKTGGLFNLLKLIRLFRLARLLQKMDRYSQYSYIILTLLMLIFSLLAHWFACFWYWIALIEIDENPPDWKIGWLHQLSSRIGQNVVNATEMASTYVTALYFTTSSLTSVGFGNVSANTNYEKVFSIVIMLIGALLHAVVFGNVTALIRVMYARRSNYQTRLRDLKDFFRLHQLPKELQQRMSDYFQTTWSLNHGIDTCEILKDFPEELCGDVSLHLHREVLSLPIFETAPPGFLKSLARHIESKFCCPTEYLIHRGDALNYLYLVCNGSMEVLQNNMVVAILGKGDLVGYDVNSILTPEQTQFQSALGQVTAAQSHLLSRSMLSLVKSSSDLKALTYCDLKCVHISGLLDVLKLYPEFSDTFHREIIHDLSFNLREIHEDPDAVEETEEEEEEEEEEEGEGDESSTAAAGDEDPDDHHEGPGPPANPRGGRGSPPPPQAPSRNPNMNHLYRSITALGHNQRGENQIGRYDHDEDEVEVTDELNEEPDEGAEADDEEHEHDLEVDEEEEELEEEEGEDEDDDDDDDDKEKRANGGGRGSGKDGGDNDRNGSGGATGNREESTNDDGENSTITTNNTNGVATTQGPGWVGGVVGGVGEGATENNNERAKHRSRRSRRRQKTEEEKEEEEAKEREEWQSSHSYDRLIDCEPTNTQVRPTQASSEFSMLAEPSGGQSSKCAVAATIIGDTFKGPAKQSGIMKETNNSASGGATWSGATQLDKRTSGSAISMASSLRQLKPAAGESSGATAGGRKPPLSFDLSRNTTAIVDRRRRSAGCIARQLLVGVAGGGGGSSLSTQTCRTLGGGGGVGGGISRRPANSGHLSLTHINEEPVSSSLRVGGSILRRENVLRAISTHSHKEQKVDGKKKKKQLNSSSSVSSLSSTTKLNGATSNTDKWTPSAAAAASHNKWKASKCDSSEQADYSSEDLRQLDARLKGVSMSVEEMKLELRCELDNFRNTIRELLLQITTTTNNNNNNGQYLGKPAIPPATQLITRRNSNSTLTNKQATKIKATSKRAIGNLAWTGSAPLNLSEGRAALPRSQSVNTFGQLGPANKSSGGAFGGCSSKATLMHSELRAALQSTLKWPQQQHQQHQHQQLRHSGQSVSLSRRHNEPLGGALTPNSSSAAAAAGPFTIGLGGDNTGELTAHESLMEIPSASFISGAVSAISDQTTKPDMSARDQWSGGPSSQKAGGSILNMARVATINGATGASTGSGANQILASHQDLIEFAKSIDPLSIHQQAQSQQQQQQQLIAAATHIEKQNSLQEARSAPLSSPYNDNNSYHLPAAKSALRPNSAQLSEGAASSNNSTSVKQSTSSLRQSNSGEANFANSDNDSGRSSSSVNSSSALISWQQHHHQRMLLQSDTTNNNKPEFTLDFRAPVKQFVEPNVRQQQQACPGNYQTNNTKPPRLAKVLLTTTSDELGSASHEHKAYTIDIKQCDEQHDDIHITRSVD